MPAFKPHTTETTSASWDGPEMRKRTRSGEDRAYYAKIYAWYDPALDEGNKYTYKFVHHMVSADGTPGPANLIGCSSAIGVLNGARGGTTIPDGDRESVYAHLAKHLRDGGQEPPELSGRIDYSESWTGDALTDSGLSAWAIWPAALRAILTAEWPVPPSGGAERQAITRPWPKTGRVARLPISGPIMRGNSPLQQLIGGTSIESISKMIHAVEADDSISTVLLDIDSPGGVVSGMPELIGELRRLRESKHVVALANSLAASAAYWIASQADEIVATPEALVGSIGVFAVHEDWSKAHEMRGVNVTYISAGKYKTSGNFDAPLDEAARSNMQAIVDDAYRLFTNDVAIGRGVSVETVRDGYGEGRVLTARAAREAGMIDRIAGFSETVSRLNGRRADAPPIDRNDENGINRVSRTLRRRRIEIAEKTTLEVDE